MSPPARELHPAQNRGLRELYAAARQLTAHWETLAERLAGAPETEELRAGVDAAQALLVELADVTPAYGLYGRPAAQSVGDRVAGLRNAVTDRTLERNQALRMAVLDLQHVTTLLGYLAEVARARGDEPLADACGRWERKLRRLESRVRKAAIASGGDPDAAVEPLDQGPLGRAGQRLAYAAGTVGEWVDRRVAERRGGRA
ncbi:MAG: hypothetical protein M3155_01065 [Actinomycetota bacterium]|nr:hypothetical protein [Actinomycetota bacterium]